MLDPDTRGQGVTRREALRSAGAAGLGLSAAGGLQGLLAAAADSAPRRGSLRDIEHVVILMQENRSFDHYFGSLSGVIGFDDRHRRRVFDQSGTDGKVVRPFRLPPSCMADITHNWGPQHHAWNGGRMDGFLRVHQQDDRPSAAETMGYYTRQDIPFYYALADAFTICDRYHCSVMGPTDPNRLMSMSATIDPAGRHGGPLLETLVGSRGKFAGQFTWKTMPERLQDRGISWKVYTDPGGGVFDNVLTYFRPYGKGSKLYDRGLAPTYPADFLSDLDRGHLPQVSWLLLSLGQSEHPAFSTQRGGELGAKAVVEALISRPEIWRKTALFITWDENGGFFDHLRPPTPPAGTRDEFLTVPKLPAAAAGVRGPIGLGFRVPMLVVSPFSRGGLVCSEVFDHTSTLRFLETRFRVGVPNLSQWRRKSTGDLTSTFHFAARPSFSKPRLPSLRAAPSCATAPPVAAHAQPFPHQERGRRRRPSGIVR